MVMYMISKNEHRMVTLYCGETEVGVITANQTETVFFLYEPDGDDYRKLGKSDSPLELERKYKMHEKMGVEP